VRPVSASTLLMTLLSRMAPAVIMLALSALLTPVKKPGPSQTEMIFPRSKSAEAGVAAGALKFCSPY
jgi:hypothetical protein